MKIGLLFGSFNPIHIGHLIIGNSVLEFVDKIWFVISPQNPFKKEVDLLDVSLRLSLVEAAIQDNERFELCTTELSMPVPSYTVDTLKILQEKYPYNRFSLIMGSDNFLNISKWKSSELILQNPIFVYERPEFLFKENEAFGSITKLKMPLLNISSTQIRNSIKAGKSIRYLLPDSVIKTIQEKKLYS